MLSLALVIAIVAAPAAMLPKRAQAFGEAVVVVGSLLEPIELGILSSTVASTQAQLSLQYKEFFGDHLAYQIAQIVIRSITSSIIRWANNGFQGNPSFVTDINGFLQNVADQAFGAFLDSQGLASLCSAFRRPIIRGLQFYFQAPYQRQFACTLSELTRTVTTFVQGGTLVTKTVTINVDDFLGGNFSAGGWDGWYSLVSEPQNNPYGAYLLSVEEAQKKIDEAKSVKQQELSFGRGFLSFENCSDGSSSNYNIELSEPEFNDSPRTCKITTPGAIIAEQVNSAVNSPLVSLQNADEINELIGAVAINLVPEILGAGGLLGVSNQSGGKSSYIDQYATADQLTGNTKGEAVSQVRRTLQDENDFLAAVQSLSAPVAAAKQNLESLKICYTEKLSASNAPGYRTQVAGFLADTDTAIETRLAPTERDVSAKIVAANTNIATLNNVIALATNAKSADDLTRVSQIYTDLLLNRSFHTISDTVVAQREQGKIQSQMDALNQDTAGKKAECEALPFQQTF